MPSWLSLDPAALLARLGDALLEPVRSLVEPDARVFWPFLASAALLSSAVWWRARRRGATVSLLGFLAPRAVFLHPSSLLDVRLLFARSVVRAFLLAPLSFSALYVAVRVWMNLRTWLGPGPLADAPRGAVLAAFALSSFVAQDLARYVVHRLAHTVPPLWELHKLHHSAEVLTPLTVYRAHPLESLLMRSGALLASAVTAGVVLWAAPGKLPGAAILGVDALAFVWTLLGANLRHSHVWISYGPWLEHVLVSPAQHQIHHSDDPRHFHKNLGSTFALWDWLGGTLHVTRGRERLRFGLPPGQKNHRDTVASALLAPLWRALGGPRWARAVRAVYRAGSSTQSTPRRSPSR